MIRIVSKADRASEPELFAQMFRGRARVFHDRLGWAVSVRDGLEIDHLDEEAEPVYVIAFDHTGSVVGSLRILSGAGPVLLKSEFGQQFVPPPDFQECSLWECSRFCVHPSQISQPHISSRLLEGLCDYGLRSGIDAIVGVFDRPMQRIYGRIGWVPSIIATSPLEPGLAVGRWSVTSEALRHIRHRPRSAGFNRYVKWKKHETLLPPIRDGRA